MPLPRQLTTGLLLLYSVSSLALSGHPIVELGGYWSSQGKQQFVAITDVIGDEFTVTHPNGKNGAVGAGYFWNGHAMKYHYMPEIDMSYGLNFFYLARTQVSGQVIQEQLFTNLAYRYNVTHYPLYAMAKAHLKSQGIILDAGVGPNFIQTSRFSETPLNSFSLPDNIYAGKSMTTFTATAGLALQINNVLGNKPIECGYRFFYLGQGHFKTLNNQVLTTLTTGNDFGNALICAVSF